MPTLWTPAELGSRVKSWGDASAAGDVSVTAGTNQTTSWANKGADATAFTPTSTGSAAPYFDPATYQINGLSAVRFHGGTAGLRMPIINGGSSVPVSAFFVHQDDNATLSQSVFGNSVGGMFGIIAQKSTLTVEINRGLAAPPEAYYRAGNLMPTPANRGEMWDLLVDTGTPSLFEMINFAVPGGTNGADRVFQAPSSFNYKGVAGEFLFVTGALTTAERQQIEGYLAHKWGLTAKLPADHPYKTTPPYTGAAPVYDVITLDASATTSGGSGSMTAVRNIAATSATLSGSSATLLNAGTPAQPKKNILLAASASNSGAVAALRAIRKIAGSSGSVSGSSAALRAIRKIMATSATASGSVAQLYGINRLLPAASATASGGSATMSVKAVTYVPFTLFASVSASDSTLAMKKRSAFAQWGSVDPQPENWSPITPQSENWSPIR